MRPRTVTLGLVLLSLLLPAGASAQSLRAARTIWASTPADVPAVAQEVDAMLRSGRLVAARTQRDGQLPGRTHERLNQYFQGVRVFGGQLVWQKEAGRVHSVTGNLFDGIEISIMPTLGAREAGDRAVAASPGTRLVGRIELVVLPLKDRFALAYYLHVRGSDRAESVFVDAGSGALLMRYSDLHRQSSVGLGIGTWSDEKKMSIEVAAGTNRAVDELRPFGIKTFDVNFDFDAWNFFMSDTDDFLATDSDNRWTDGAVVDAHAYSGYTYDYYFKRHGRRGLDDAGLAAINFVHIFRQSFGYNNAFYYPLDHSMNYGDGDGVTFNYFSSSLEVVAHELTHGVTDFTSELIYEDESGALNEAFSDIMATSVEWYFEPPGQGRLRADWITGEDLYYRFGRYFRSFENPRSAGDPDHYRARYRGSEDNGGVHSNSSIANHAFYLMVQGGTNRTSGARVDGLGMDRMDHLESIFYRAFVFYLVPSSNFHAAREATIRAAQELYGAGSAEENVVRQGWDAVGVF